ncbi:hypothetical protein L227DRAFT_610390 [Lentinus tigrinus ALCF2SS1-6]|uniref:Uncharacterized protein n=1 Tax=Lentinus tigrinus ALCF2SS1-6 TaxID=1328759 RepID=A0A5C2SC17_9APHY|nr:hypothetical protein L227DRAFT_610390 [Lentinus tigrinus ALCF2SS1-6]
MPEFVLEHGMPTLQEPVHVLVKFILYVAQDEKLLVMRPYPSRRSTHHVV